MLIDSHCHLADEGFTADLAGIVTRARAVGVSQALCILSADEPEEVTRAARVSELWPAVLFSAGIHPHRSGAYAGRVQDAVAAVRAAVAKVGAVAIGEIGLDYHYDVGPAELQREVFEAQIETAVELDLPIVVHTREAADDTSAVLDRFTGRVRGVMHCFTGTADEAASALARGFYLSFSGILTFPKAELLRTLAAQVPVERLLIETDAPYLAPVPHRGKRNEPAWVNETLSTLARVREMSPSNLSAQIATNFERLLGRKGLAHAR